MTGKLTLLPGDGIGPEVMEAAVRVMQHVAERFNFTFELEEKLIGGASIDQFGTPLADETDTKPALDLMRFCWVPSADRNGKISSIK